MFKIILFLSLSLSGFVFAQNYQLDTSFQVKNNGIGFTYIKKLSNGQLLVGGYGVMPYSDFESVNGFALINPDGNIDHSLNLGNGLYGVGSVKDAEIQSDGKIIIGGTFVNYDNQSVDKLIRINADGSIDESFMLNIGVCLDETINSNYIPTINAIEIQADGKILIAGLFISFNNIAKKKIVRLNQDGSIDNSFNAGITSNGEIFDMYLDNNNKITIVGSFTSVNNSTQTKIARLNENGSIDDTFISGLGFDGNPLTIFKDGNYLLVGGGFTTYNGSNVNRIVRLTESGQIDNTFNSNLGFDNYVNKIDKDFNDRYVVTGQFNNYHNNACGKIARINSDGSFDTDFNTVNGFNWAVQDFSIISNDTIICVGSFTTFNGDSTRHIAKIVAGDINNIPTLNKNGFTFKTNLNSNQLTINFDQQNTRTDISLTSMNGQVVLDDQFIEKSEIIIDLSDFSRGLYFLNIETSSNREFIKLLIN